MKTLRERIDEVRLNPTSDFDSILDTELTAGGEEIATIKNGVEGMRKLHTLLVSTLSKVKVVSVDSDESSEAVPFPRIRVNVGKYSFDIKYYTSDKGIMFENVHTGYSTLKQYVGIDSGYSLTSYFNEPNMEGFNEHVAVMKQFASVVKKLHTFVQKNGSAIEGFMSDIQDNGGIYKLKQAQQSTNIDKGAVLQSIIDQIRTQGKGKSFDVVGKTIGEMQSKFDKYKDLVGKLSISRNIYSNHAVDRTVLQDAYLFDFKSSENLNAKYAPYVKTSGGDYTFKVAPIKKLKIKNVGKNITFEAETELSTDYANNASQKMRVGNSLNGVTPMSLYGNVSSKVNGKMYPHDFIMFLMLTTDDIDPILDVVASKVL